MRSGPGTAAVRFDIHGVAFGPFHHVTSLNPRFVAGVPRLKIALSVAVGDGRVDAAGALARLSAIFPSIALHRCGTGAALGEALAPFRAGAAPDGGCRDAALDLAHLFEHVAIEVQHYVGRMRVCSGITCAWERPRDRFDLFVECPDEAVGRIAVAIAAGALTGVMSGEPADPQYRCLMQVARLARDHPGSDVRARLRTLGRAWARAALLDAVSALAGAGFLSPLPLSFNYSGGDVLGFVSREGQGAAS